MFTGLIQDVGVVERVASGAMTDLWIRTRALEQPFALGESIACDGCCLTVVEAAGPLFKVQASPETLRRTTLGRWTPGTAVNLEKAMRLGDRLGGHLVLGHVDEVGQVLDRRTEGGSLVISFSLSPALDPFFIEKGSVAIDGISLTVNTLQPGRFSVALIPETQTRTTLASKSPGTAVNLEGDLIGKYVARLHGRHTGGKGLSEAALKAAGFSEG
jgi:riboflavin synthase